LPGTGAKCCLRISFPFHIFSIFVDYDLSCFHYAGQAIDDLLPGVPILNPDADAHMSIDRETSTSFTNRLANMDKRLLFCLLCLVQAAVYLLDHLTGPLIPLGPYYLLTVGLATWHLGILPSVFFVIVSSLLRTYSLSLLFPSNAAILYAGDFASSLLIYGVFAFLVWRSRHAYQALFSYTGDLESRVKRAEHWHRLESSIRRAVPQDVEEIVRLTVLGAEDGDLSKDVLNTVRQQALQLVYRDSIQKGAGSRPTWSGQNEIVPIEFWIAEINGKIAGYFMIMGIDQRLGAERELHAISVAREFRSLGVGSAMVDFFCSHYYGRRLYAACMPESRMHKMLKRRGFYHFANSNEGYVIVERVERPREKGLLHDVPSDRLAHTA
jgi:ribosomal protein S18 acetylase RimI-like enzyme